MILNKVKVEGNSIFIRSNPVTGILALTSFTDNASGVDGSNTFAKTFRYSTNGIIFSDWQTLTAANIMAIPVVSKDVLVIELQYTKNPVGSAQLNVSSATINTTDDALTDTELFKNTIFYSFFGSNDPEVLNWMINVLEKLFERGILPNYIDRYNDFDSPDDFIEFWGSICKFFAFYVVYARKYQKFYESEVLLSEYLEQRGLTVSSQNSLVELQEMMQKYNREIARRGTVHIVDKGGLDGEMLRLIHYQAGDEFIFNANKPQHIGWFVDQHSPLFRSITGHDNANKWFEPAEEPEDINQYPVSGDVQVITDNGINKKVLSIGAASGIVADAGKRIVVDEFMDYELSFFIKKTDGDNLTVGFEAFDKDGNPVSLQSRTDGTDLNYFFQNKNLQRSDKYIYVRLFLYGKMKPVFAEDGINLKMVDGVNYVSPVISMGAGTATLYNVRFMPMALSYSKGFVQVNNFIDCFLKNNNHKFSLGEIDTHVRHYFIPYSSQIKIVETIKEGDISQNTEAPPPAPVAGLATVTTTAPAGVAPTSAILGGNVTADGGSAVTERGIVWSLATGPTLADNRMPNGIGTGVFSANVTGLPSGSTIYVRAYVINGAGVAYGNEVTCTLTVGVVSISRANASPINAASVVFNVTLSKAVTGVAQGNFALALTGIADATITGVTGAGANWQVTVDTGTGDGTIGLNMVNDGGLSEVLSNVPFVGQVYLIDKTPPVVAFTSTPSVNSNSKNATFGFTATDQGGSGLFKSYVSIDGGAFVEAASPYTFTNLADGAHTVQLKALDNAGNESAVVEYQWNISTAAPYVVSIVRFNPPDEIITTGTTGRFKVTFSELVTGVDIYDFQIARTGNVNGTISDVLKVVDISDEYYVVVVDNIVGTGSLRLDLKPSGTGIQNSAGLFVNSGYTNGEVYTIEPETLTIVYLNTQPRTQYTGLGDTENHYLSVAASQPIDTAITVSFSYAVNGNWQPGGEVEIGAGERISNEVFIEALTINDSIEYRIDSVSPTESTTQKYLF